MKELPNLRVLTIGNRGIENYPGNFTEIENSIIRKACTGDILHLFSGKSGIGDVRIDLSCNEATHNIDVFEFLDANHMDFDTVILDPPYNDKFAGKYQKLNTKNPQANQFVIFANTPKTTELFTKIAQMNPKKIIMKCWQYYNFSSYGYQDAGSYLLYYGGYRKPAFLMILEKGDDIPMVENRSESVHGENCDQIYCGELEGEWNISIAKK